MIKFSIIIPTYNHLEDCLKPCIDSIIRDTDLSDKEIIVVMNGCTDGTKQYLDSLDQPIVILEFSDPIGYPKAINAGLKVSKGDYLILLNNDVTFLEWGGKNTWVNQLLEPFNIVPNCGITGCFKSYNADIDRNFLIFFCVMISRQCFNNVGYLNEIFSPGSSEDIDYCVRAEKKGFVLEQIPYKEVGATVDKQLITTYPIYHIAESTVANLENWGNIFKRNLEILVSYHRYPKISIIIPTYNHLEDCLKPCCESIIGNTDFKHVDVIIVANGCTDDTKKYIESLGSSFKLLWFEQALGYTKAINEGLKAANGDYIILLNNDVVLLDPTWVSRLLKPFLLDDNVGITGPLKFKFPCGSIQKTAIAFWCCCFKKSIINEIGLLDESYNPGMGEDGAYCIEMESIGYKVIQVPVDTINNFGEGPSDSSFPIWHKGNGTFSDNPNLKNEIIGRNQNILNNNYANPLELTYIQAATTFSDTYILLPYFRRYANRCEHITEFGVRDVCSTWAFLSSKPKKMISYDLYTSINIKSALDIAKNLGIDFNFIEQNILDIDIEETDLLFIDTLHTYKQLSTELKLHADKVRKYILFHDTFTWREKDEAETDTDKKGLYTAIQEFLSTNFQWKIELDLSDSHGLIVLKRIPKYSIIIPTCTPSIKNCLERVFEYTDLKDKEIIVVANGCSSEFITYLYSLRKKIYIINLVEKSGQIKPVNEGAKIAQGEYIILLDDDSLLLIQEKDLWIKLLYEPFIKNEKTGLTGPIMGGYDGLGNVIHSGCAMYKKSVWEEVNGADPIFEFGYLWDTDISLRIKEKGYDTVAVGQINGQMMYPLYHEDSPATTDKKQKDADLLKRNRDILYSRHNKKVNEKLTYFPTVENIRVSIIIPTYNHLEDCLRPCVESMLKHTNFDGVEVLVVANGCKDGTKEYIEGLGKPFKLIWFDEGLGFTKATNAGIKEAKGKYIILLNNDTVFLDKGQPKNTWMEMLLAPFKSDEKVGITGPLQLYDNYAGYMVSIFFCVMIKKELIEELAIYEEIVTKRRLNKQQYEVLPEEEKKKFQKWYLDPDFSPGGGEDVDFSVKAVKAGYKQIIVPDSNVKLTQSIEGLTNEGQFPIWHIGEGTFGSNADYGNRIIKVNGMRNMSRHHPQIKDGVIKLNFGSGGVDIPGFVSIDKYDKRAAIQLDIFDIDIFPDNSVDEIISIHLIEHLNIHRIMEIFKKWNSILKPGGKLTLEMPDFEETAKQFIAAKTWREKEALMNTVYAPVNTTSEGKPSDVISYHVWGYWPEFLENHLNWAGFIDIKFMPEQFPHPGYNFRCECIKPKG